MLKRIIMWQLKDGGEQGSKKDNAQALKTMLEKLPAKIPEIEKFKVAINSADDSAAADLVLIGFFADRQAFEQVLSHPEHQKVEKFLKDIVSDQRFVEYED